MKKLLVTAVCLGLSSLASAGVGRTLLTCSQSFQVVQSEQSGLRKCAGGPGHCEYLGITNSGTLPIGAQLSDSQGRLHPGNSAVLSGGFLTLTDSQVTFKVPVSLLTPNQEGEVSAVAHTGGQVTELQLHCQSTQYVSRLLLLVNH